MHHPEEISSHINKATAYIESVQASDGSWYGSWGVCFTYATWFGINELIASGKSYSDSPAIHKACEFLLSKQLSNGGWKEGYLSCQNKVYSNLENSRAHLVNTSWTLLALIVAGQDVGDSIAYSHVHMALIMDLSPHGCMLFAMSTTVDRELAT
ncbi:hypothetical protein HN51_055394 [Arachis hypogaea]